MAIIELGYSDRNPSGGCYRIEANSETARELANSNMEALAFLNIRYYVESVTEFATFDTTSHPTLTAYDLALSGARTLFMWTGADWIPLRSQGGQSVGGVIPHCDALTAYPNRPADKLMVVHEGDDVPPTALAHVHVWCDFVSPVAVAAGIDPVIQFGNHLNPSDGSFQSISVTIDSATGEGSASITTPFLGLSATSGYGFLVARVTTAAPGFQNLKYRLVESDQVYTP